MAPYSNAGRRTFTSIRPVVPRCVAVALAATAALSSGCTCRDGADDRVSLVARSHPTDAELIGWFEAHREKLDRVVSLLRADPGLANGVPGEADTSRRAGTAPGTAADEYAHLTDDLGLQERVVLSADRHRIELTISNRGYATHNSQKGLLFSSEPVRDDVLPDLDALSRKGVGSGVRALTDDWYLFFEGY